MSTAADRATAPPPPAATWTLIELPEAESVAHWVASRLLEAGRAEPERPLGLATGRTMDPVYAALAMQMAQLPEEERQQLLRHWLSFNLDEYAGLASVDRRSFHAAMTEHLVRPLGLDPRRVRLPDGGAEDPEAEAERYAGELSAAGSIGLQILGMGLNGHVGFNEPPCGPDVGCRCVALSAVTRRANAPAFGGDPQAVPLRAITLGLREILAAEQILLVVTGAAKAPILKRLLQVHSPSPDLPASWLQRHPHVTVVADRAALAGER